MMDYILRLRDILHLIERTIDGRIYGLRYPPLSFGVLGIRYYS